MADEPEKKYFCILQELNKEKAMKISTHQTFLLLYRQKLEALFKLFNAELKKKLEQSTRRIIEIFFRRGKSQRSTSLIPIIGRLLSRLYGLSTKEVKNIQRINVTTLNTVMNTTLYVQKY